MKLCEFFWSFDASSAQQKVIYSSFSYDDGTVVYCGSFTCWGGCRALYLTPFKGGWWAGKNILFFCSIIVLVLIHLLGAVPVPYHFCINTHTLLLSTGVAGGQELLVYSYDTGNCIAAAANSRSVWYGNISVYYWEVWWLSSLVRLSNGSRSPVRVSNPC